MPGGSSTLLKQLGLGQDIIHGLGRSLDSLAARGFDPVVSERAAYHRENNGGGQDEAEPLGPALVLGPGLRLFRPDGTEAGLGGLIKKPGTGKPSLKKFVAQATGLDHLEVIRRNLVPNNAFPYRAAGGALLDSGDYQKVVDIGVESGRLAELVERRDKARAEGRLYGIGLAAVSRW